MLLIEDDPTIGAELVDGLTREGFDVEHETDGRSGLLRALDDHFDVIVLDLLLPRLNGYQVLDQLRSSNTAVPVLVLTAKTGEYDLADVLEAGADDFVSKPFSFIELTARVRNLLSRRNRGPRSTLQVGNLELDPLRRTVRRGEDTIALAPTEFRVLERLMVAAPSVVTHQEFLDEVWDPADPPDPNIVQLYIGYLRRKVDEPFGTRSIVTVRGAGYRIESLTPPDSRVVST